MEECDIEADCYEQESPLAQRTKEILVKLPSELR